MVEVPTKPVVDRHNLLPATRASGWSSSVLERVFPARFAPVFLSPGLGLAVNLAGVGGGRGLVASRDLEAGELLLVERPLARRLVDSVADEAATLAEVCRGDPEVAAAVRAIHPVGDSCEIDRLTRVWTLSAFETGLYPHQSLFNDSPEPTCIQMHVAEDDVDEVWTTRPVSRGDALTLSYVVPVDASPTRRAVVLAHHDFLGPVPDDDPLEVALDRIEEDLIHEVVDADTLAAAREAADAARGDTTATTAAAAAKDPVPTPRREPPRARGRRTPERLGRRSPRLRRRYGLARPPRPRSRQRPALPGRRRGRPTCRRRPPPRESLSFATAFGEEGDAGGTARLPRRPRRAHRPTLGHPCRPQRRPRRAPVPGRPRSSSLRLEALARGLISKTDVACMRPRLRCVGAPRIFVELQGRKGFQSLRCQKACSTLPR